MDSRRVTAQPGGYSGTGNDLGVPSKVLQTLAEEMKFINTVNTVTLPRGTAGYAKLMDAAQNASETHRSMLAAAGAESTLRRQMGTAKPKRPLTAAEAEEARMRDAVADAQRRKWANIEAKHAEYERIQKLSATRPPNRFNEIEFGRKVTRILEKTPLQVKLDEVIDSADMTSHQRAVQRYIDWQDQFYTPLVEALRSNVDEHCRNSKATRRAAYEEFLAASSKGQGVFLDSATSSKYDPFASASAKNRVRITVQDPLKKQLTREAVERRLLITGVTSSPAPVKAARHKVKQTLHPTKWEQKALRQTPFGRFGFRATKNFSGQSRTNSAVVFDDYTSAKSQSFNKSAVDAEFPRGVRSFKAKYQSHGVEHQSANVYQPGEQFAGSPRIAVKLSDRPDT